MSSISKHQNVSQEVNSRQLGKRFEDKITNLPFSLKTKILSYLSTRDAVKTSILSRKWKLSWTSVTNLDFGDHLFNIRPEDYKSVSENFISFVNRVLMLRERSSLQRFRMRCWFGYKGPLVNTWIAAVLRCHVQELDLDISIKRPSLLTSDIFTCKTLVFLKLHLSGPVNMPTSVSLPNLKTLHIECLKFLDDVSIRNLLSGCPVLDELKLWQCIGDDVRVVNVIAPALTVLILAYLPCEDSGIDTEFMYEIVLDTPALEFLYLNDYVAKVYVVQNLNHLIQAEITFGNPGEDTLGDYTEPTETLSKTITNLLNRTSQVQILKLSDNVMQAINLCDPALPIYNNLISLELCTTRPIGWRYLPKILKNSPCLETLILLQENRYDDIDGHRDYFSADEVPSCFHSHLKVIKIVGFEGFADDMKMAKYFLKNAKVLEQLTLDNQQTPYHDPPVFYKKLLMMRRASYDCTVKVL